MRILVSEHKLLGEWEVLEKKRLLTEDVVSPWRCRSAVVFAQGTKGVVYRKRWWGLKGWERYMDVDDELTMRICREGEIICGERGLASVQQAMREARAEWRKSHEEWEKAMQEWRVSMRKW